MCCVSVPVPVPSFGAKLWPWTQLFTAPHLSLLIQICDNWLTGCQRPTSPPKSKTQCNAQDTMPGDQHTMDDKNIALCYYYRNPPDGSKAMAYDDICELVQLRDGEHPVKSAVFKAVACLARLETWQPSSCWCVRARCVCVCVPRRSLRPCIFTVVPSSPGGRRVFLRYRTLARRRPGGAGRRVGGRPARTRTSTALSDKHV